MIALIVVNRLVSLVCVLLLVLTLMGWLLDRLIVRLFLSGLLFGVMIWGVRLALILNVLIVLCRLRFGSLNVFRNVRC